jgi:hypothetical protein
VLGGVSGLAFSPNQVSSTQAFYDPSDLSSLYQSRTGGSIVSADGQTVGIMLDKSQMGSKTAAAFIAAAVPGPMVAGVYIGTLETFDEDGYIIISRNADTTQSSYVDPVTLSGGLFHITLTVVTDATEAGNLVQIRDGNNPVSGTYGPGVYTFIYSFTGHWRVAAASPAHSAKVLIKAVPLSRAALAPSDAARPLYKTDGTHHYVDYDGVDDVLNATLPDLGSTASVWYMKQDGTAVYAANQSISGAYALPAVDMRGLIIVDGPISASDQTKLSAYYA